MTMSELLATAKPTDYISTYDDYRKAIARRGVVRELKAGEKVRIVAGTTRNDKANGVCLFTSAKGEMQVLDYYGVPEKGAIVLLNIRDDSPIAVKFVSVSENYDLEFSVPTPETSPETTPAE